MGIAMTWNDGHRKLDMALASVSRMLAPTPRTIEIDLQGVTKDGALRWQACFGCVQRELSSRPDITASS